MKNWGKGNIVEKENKNKIFSNKNFKPIQFHKIDNTCKTEFNRDKNNVAIILFKKQPNKKTSINKNKNISYNIKTYNYSKSNVKKNETLNNTFHGKNKIICNKNNKRKNKTTTKDKNDIKYKMQTTNEKRKNLTKLKLLEKNFCSPTHKFNNKNGKNITFTEMRNKTPMKDIKCFLSNKKDNELTSFIKINKNNKKASVKHWNQKIDYNFKTFYKEKSYNSKNLSKNEDNKDLISKENLFALKRNKSFNNQNLNIKTKEKKNNKRKKNNNYIIDDSFNNFNITYTHKKEINSYSCYKSKNSINKNNNKLKPKPRVNTLEYLTKILNSIKSNNLSSIINKKNDSNNIDKNKNQSYINIFRKKNIEKNKSDDEKTEIKKFIKVKKKLYKLTNIKKRKKEKEEELKKYLELYKLEKNIHISNNNTFYQNNKTQNVSDLNKKIGINNNNSEYFSSIDSTIVDKNNFYQGIMDIQNIYSNNIINNKIIINNYPYLNLNKENHLYNNKTGNDISQQKDKKINSRNNLDNTHIYHKENISEIYKKNLYSELKEEKIAEINYTYSSPRREEQKEIIKETDSEKKINEDNLNNDLKDFQINELNEYSFKLNNSNEDSNELKEINENNTLTTSKFGNSQLLSEQNRQSNKILTNDKEKETEKKTEKDKFNFTKEQLDNYKEILSSLFEYIKLITQRNALNDIISYGDMKYKYKIGFEIILTLIKLAPFNIIRAIQQTQYYHFVFRQLFIPYITRSFHKLKTFCSYHKLFEKGEKEIKFIYKKIAIKKINQFKMKENNNNIDKNNDLIKDENLEEIKEILNLDKKGFDAISNKDLSESKESDYIEWDDSFFSDKQDTNK